MPSLPITETTPLLPTLPVARNTNTWIRVIKNWTTGIYQESKHFIIGSLWISSAITIIASLNIIFTQVNCNEDIDFEKLFATLMKWEIISNAAGSLFISFIKKRLTNFGSRELEKTLFYKKWSKLKHKLFSSQLPTTKLSFEEIKNKINDIEINKIKLTSELKEFQRLRQQLVTIFETLLIKKDNNDFTLPMTNEENDNNIEEIINTTNPKTTCSLITNELINVIVSSTVLTCGVAFSSVINIIKNDIANNLSLNWTSFLHTFTTLNNIIISFSGLIIFKLKFNLIENGLKNFKQLLLLQLIKKIINKQNISQTEIEAEYQKIALIRAWYHLKISKLEPNLKEIQTALAITNINPNNDYGTIIFQNTKYLLRWLVPTATATIIDSFFDIITAQISANKPVNFLNNLKLLICQENIIVSIIAQIGFSIKLNITDFCWEKFKNTYTHQILQYFFIFPKKCYQTIFSKYPTHHYNLIITKENVETLVTNYYQKFETKTKILITINTKLKQEIINTKLALDTNEINNLPLPAVIKPLQKIEKLFY